MEFSFLTDLDEYFCEKYANYDKLCVQEGYKIPLMQQTKKLEDGRTYAYTLPANTMRLSLQEKKDEILARLKGNLHDEQFSFSFKPLSLWGWLTDVFDKYAFKKWFPRILQKYNYTIEQVEEKVPLRKKIWKRIQRGRYYPTKTLLFNVALSLGLSLQDTELLLRLCGQKIDESSVKDVVVSYLLQNKITNPDMIERAFLEYKITSMKLR